MTDLWNPNPPLSQAEIVANLRREQARRELGAMREKLRSGEESENE